MKNKQLLIGALTGIVLVFIFSTLVVEKRLSDAKEEIQTAINDQTDLVKTIAKDLGEGKAVEFAQNEEIISVCQAEESQQYDTLLSSLDNGLSGAELEKLENLFNHCGAIPAASRAFMVYVLEEEVETLSFLIAQQALISGSTVEEASLASWRELISKEQEIQTQFYALVALQGKIINTLQSQGTEGVTEIQNEVQDVQQKYAAAIAAASELRTTLVAP